MEKSLNALTISDIAPHSPFLTDPVDLDILHSASTHARHAGWRGEDRQMELAGIDSHSSPQDICGFSGLSASPPAESYSEISSDILSSPSTESYGQSGEQDDYPDPTSFPRGQVEGTTLGLVVVETQGQSAPTQKAPRKRQQNLQKQLKKRKDMERKRAQRSDDGKTFEKICELLKIPARPKKTLVCRSA